MLVSHRAYCASSWICNSEKPPPKTLLTKIPLSSIIGKIETKIFKFLDLLLLGTGAGLKRK
jgi:hypothetical protein